MFGKIFLIAAGLALVAGPAGARSLRDIRARDSEEQALAREAAYTSRVCGRTIAARIDWSSAENWPAHESLADACDGALGAVEAVCRSSRRMRVTDFVCAADGSGPDLSGGVLRYGASPGGNGFDETMSYLDGGE